jgi:hypothetical protein
MTTIARKLTALFTAVIAGFLLVSCSGTTPEAISKKVTEETTTEVTTKIEKVVPPGNHAPIDNELEALMNNVNDVLAARGEQARNLTAIAQKEYLQRLQDIDKEAAVRMKEDYTASFLKEFDKNLKTEVAELKANIHKENVRVDERLKLVQFFADQSVANAGTRADLLQRIELQKQAIYLAQQRMDARTILVEKLQQIFNEARLDNKAEFAGMADLIK